MVEYVVHTLTWQEKDPGGGDGGETGAGLQGLHQTHRVPPARHRYCERYLCYSISSLGLNVVFI